MPNAPPPAREGNPSRALLVGQPSHAEARPRSLRSARALTRCDGRGGSAWGNHGFPRLEEIEIAEGQVPRVAPLRQFGRIVSEALADEADRARRRHEARC